MDNLNDLNNTNNNHMTTAETSTKATFTGGIKSRKRFRIQCWSEEQSEKIKIIKPSNFDKSTQTQQTTDELADSLKFELYEKFKNKLEKNLDCGICKEIYLDSCILPCGHIFCSYCIRMWFLHADTCPICRITTEFVIGTKILDNFIKDALSMFDETAVETRDALINDRKSVLQKVESNWVVQNTNSYYTTPEMWQDWLNLQNNSVELLNSNSYDETSGPDNGQNADTTESTELSRDDQRTINNLWPWETDESFANFVIPPPPPPILTPRIPPDSTLINLDPSHSTVDIDSGIVSPDYNDDDNIDLNQQSVYRNS